MGVMEGGPAGEQDGQAVTGCLGARLAKRRGGAVTEDAAPMVWSGLVWLLGQGVTCSATFPT